MSIAQLIRNLSKFKGWRNVRVMVEGEDQTLHEIITVLYVAERNAVIIRSFK